MTMLRVWKVLEVLTVRVFRVVYSHSTPYIHTLPTKLLPLTLHGTHCMSYLTPTLHVIPTNLASNDLGDLEEVDR